MPSIHKSELIKLAEAKAGDALLLLRHARYSNAYYLAGYAVEIGLKAIIAGEFQRDTLPDRGFVGKVFVHNLEALAGLAGLATKLREKRRVDAEFDSNWAVVANWTEESRYEATDAMRATAMVDAILNERSGVLSWLKMHW